VFSLKRDFRLAWADWTYKGVADVR